MSDDDDDPPSPSPPLLKKAKYLWQIKGNSSRSHDEPCSSHESPSISDRTHSAEDQEEDPPCKMIIAWQAHHLAKALFDNTINTLIENMSFPLPEMGAIMDRYTNQRTNSNLEDQAVRMAIRSHGLQNPCSCSHQRPAPHVDCYTPFHHRTDSSLFGGPSSSNSSLRAPDLVEQDIISEAVNVAILNKGLGASHGRALN